MPYRQVTRSQTMAASRAATTRSWVASAGGTIPLPTVVPVRAPTTLRTPAISTAVATEVAMALAVSWKPLMKSKTRAMATIRTSVRSAELGILHPDPFQCVVNVLGAVGGILEVLVDLSPADPLDEAVDIIDALELLHECPVEHIVGLVLEPLDVDRTVEQVIPLPPVFQVWHSAGDECCLVTDNAGQQTGVLGWLIDAVEPDSSNCLLDGIDEVIEPTSQVSDVFTVERRDEGAVECVEDLVSDLVTPLFEVPHPPGLTFDLAVVVEQVAQGLCDFRGVLGGLVEVVEKTLVLREEAC